MNNHPTEVWAKIEALLSGQTTKATFNAHIHPLQAIERHNGTLTLSCPPNSLDWLEKRLYVPILQAAQTVDETIQTIAFVASIPDAIDTPVILEGAYHQGANALIKPNKVEVHTQYFRHKWRPKLGPLLSELVRELRQRCYYGQGEDRQRRDTVEATLPDLAKALGVSRSTILRALKRDDDGKFENEFLHYFIRETEIIREYDPQKGKMINKATRFTVFLDEPLTPEDEQKLAQKS